MSREMRKEGRKEGKKEGRKDGKERNEEIPPFLQRDSVWFFFDSCIYLLVILLLYICFDVNFNYLTLGCSRRAL